MDPPVLLRRFADRTFEALIVPFGEGLDGVRALGVFGVGDSEGLQFELQRFVRADIAAYQHRSTA